MTDSDLEDRLRHVEALLIEYVERFGLTERARDYLVRRPGPTRPPNDNQPSG